tara:strand:+ start:19596 stop:20180 length:585 start_codon:yes stop_codon:yes gene_type:complete
MRSIYLLLIFHFALSFHNTFKIKRPTYLFALRKPSQKDYDNMDEFERFEKHTDEQDWEKQNEYLWKIYYKINNITEPTKILQLDFANMIDVMDKNIMTNLIGKIPKRPETEEEIVDDSFEGYLKGEFQKIPKTKLNLINFDSYFEWRQKAGIVLTKEEVYYFYSLIVGDEGQLCDIMQFIAINHLIDESDAPLY